MSTYSMLYEHKAAYRKNSKNPHGYEQKQTRKHKRLAHQSHSTMQSSSMCPDKETFMKAVKKGNKVT